MNNQNLNQYCYRTFPVKQTDIKYIINTKKVVYLTNRQVLLCQHHSKMAIRSIHIFIIYSLF